MASSAGSVGNRSGAGSFLASSIAGSGLGISGTTLAVQVDGTTIEIANDALRHVRGTNGQVLIGQTSADPVFASLSGDASLSAAGVVKNAQYLRSRCPALGTAIGSAVSSTTFLTLEGDNGVNATETTQEVPIFVAGSISEILVDMVANALSTGNIVLTLRKNGADTALATTVTSGTATGILSLAGTPVTVAAGDRICLKATYTTAGNATFRGARTKLVPS